MMYSHSHESGIHPDTVKAGIEAVTVGAMVAALVAAAGQRTTLTVI